MNNKINVSESTPSGGKPILDDYHLLKVFAKAWK